MNWAFSWPVWILNSSAEGIKGSVPCRVVLVGQIKHPDLGVSQPTKEADYSWLSRDFSKQNNFLGESPWFSLSRKIGETVKKQKYRIRPSELCSGHAWFSCHTKRCFALREGSVYSSCPKVTSSRSQISK